MTDNKPTDKEIIKSLECCIKETSDCDHCPLFIPADADCFNISKAGALDIIYRLQAENENLEYKLAGVMHFVDKWLDGAELEQNEVNRASAMREKTLQIVENQQAEIEKLNALSKHHQTLINMLNEGIAEAKAEAIKELMFNLDEEISTYSSNGKGLNVYAWLKNYVKEMVGEDK